MIDFMKKLDIIHLKRNGCSNREVARRLEIDRKTVARYWNRYLSEVQKLKDSDMDAKETQEQIVSKPKYDSSHRVKVKYTEKMDLRLKHILKTEIEKDKLLGNHKQSLTKKQIHEKLLSEGFDISYSTITVQINKILKSAKECFIRQKYDLGDRLEYDFGEVKLHINGETKDYHMAVLSSPSGEFRWAYLYRNQKKDVFLDSHVKFFEMVGGVYKEVVYDNMKNVVAKFIGRNEKELNEDLIKLSIYYGFKINVTNCFYRSLLGYYYNVGTPKQMQAYLRRIDNLCRVLRPFDEVDLSLV